MLIGRQVFELSAGGDPIADDVVDETGAAAGFLRPRRSSTTVDPQCSYWVLASERVGFCGQGPRVLLQLTTRPGARLHQYPRQTRRASWAPCRRLRRLMMKSSESRS